MVRHVSTCPLVSVCVPVGTRLSVGRAAAPIKAVGMRGSRWPPPTERPWPAHLGQVPWSAPARRPWIPSSLPASCLPMHTPQEVRGPNPGPDPGSLCGTTCFLENLPEHSGPWTVFRMKRALKAPADGFLRVFF